MTANPWVTLAAWAGIYFLVGIGLSPIFAVFERQYHGSPLNRDHMGMFVLTWPIYAVAAVIHFAVTCFGGLVVAILDRSNPPRREEE